MDNDEQKVAKVSYIGAPAYFALEMACQTVSQAFGPFGCYLVGSCLSRPNWRDVDVRCLLRDEDFAALFPITGALGTAHGGHWEHDPRWLLMTTSISQWLKAVTSLPVDFQFQPQTWANEHFQGQRQAIGFYLKENL